MYDIFLESSVPYLYNKNYFRHADLNQDDQAAQECIAHTILYKSELFSFTEASMNFLQKTKNITLGINYF